MTFGLVYSAINPALLSSLPGKYSKVKEENEKKKRQTPISDKTKKQLELLTNKVKVFKVVEIILHTWGEKTCNTDPGKDRIHLFKGEGLP